MKSPFQSWSVCRYTAAHVAAQYGQTALLYYLALRWDPEVNELDNDGRTCLHWAAYKGFTDTIRLLLVLNAQIDITDKEGCTALHWAAIRGNGEACTVLIQVSPPVISHESVYHMAMMPLLVF